MYMHTHPCAQISQTKQQHVPVADSPVVWSDVPRRIAGFRGMPAFAPVPVGDASVRRLRSSRQPRRSSLAAEKRGIKSYGQTTLTSESSASIRFRDISELHFRWSLLHVRLRRGERER